MHPYDHIFYIPKNYELLKKFGTKDKSIEYLDMIQEKYMEVLRRLKVKYTILSNNQNEQVEFIKNYLIKNYL